jgi:hypothetical protein
MRRHDYIYLGKAQNQEKTRVCHTMALPFYIKKYLIKEKLKWQTQDIFLKLKYFTMQKYNIQKLL